MNLKLADSMEFYITEKKENKVIVGLLPELHTLKVIFIIGVIEFLSLAHV